MSAHRQRKPNPLDYALKQTTLGNMAATICDTVDAAPAAVLAHLAAVVGTAVGRGPSTGLLGEEHANLFVLVIGKTGHGRKGTSWNPVKKAAFEGLPDWATDGIMSGLSTGEGLLAHFRGDVPEEVPGEPPLPATAPPPTLVVESEFASVFKRGAREGSTLTELLRQLWEDHRGATMTRKDPLKVSGAHLSVVGHVTPADLLALASKESIANGTMNRFLAVWSERSGPQRTRVDRHAVARARRELGPLLRDSVAFGRTLGHVEFSDEAGEHWDALVAEFDREPVTMVDELSQRAPSYLARLALVFAIVDQVDRIALAHLRAAEEMWRYSVQSWAHVYGDRVGDPLAEKILAHLADAGLDGLTRSEVRSTLSKAQIARLDDVRLSLEGAGLIWTEKIPPSEVGGRPVEIWRAVQIDPTNPGNLENLAPELSPSEVLGVLGVSVVDAQRKAA